MLVGFETALPAIRRGSRVYRLGWNGKGMWVYLVPDGTYPAQTDAVRKHIGTMVPYAPYLALKTAGGEVVPWTLSQSDVLAQDWIVIPDEQVNERLEVAVKAA